MLEKKEVIDKNNRFVHDPPFFLAFTCLLRGGHVQFKIAGRHGPPMVYSDASRP